MRVFARLLALLALIVPGQAIAFTIVVTEPGTPLVPNSVIELAQRLGYFQREGVDVNFLRVAGTPTAMAALSAGQGDMANVSLESLLKITARGDTRFRAVASPAKSFSYVIAAREAIATVPQLRGKLFGIGQRGTLDDTLSRTVLRHKGIDPDDLRIVSVGHPEVRLKSLKAGKIDATTISFGSWAALPDKSGLHVIVSKDDFFHAAPVIAKVNIVSESALHEKRSEVIKVTAAIVKLARDFARNPQRWAEAMIKARPDVPPAELRALAKAYTSDWCIDGCLDPSELRRSADLLASGPAFEDVRTPPMSRWADFSILSDILAEIGRDRDVQRAER